MQTKTIYIAKDGKEFSSNQECLAHERTLETKSLKQAALREAIDKMMEIRLTCNYVEAHNN